MFYSTGDAISLVEYTLLACCSLGWCLSSCWQACCACMEMWSALQRIQVENAHLFFCRAPAWGFWSPDKIRRNFSTELQQFTCVSPEPSNMQPVWVVLLNAFPSHGSSGYIGLTCMLPANQVFIGQNMLQPTRNSRTSQKIRVWQLEKACWLP